MLVSAFAFIDNANAQALAEPASPHSPFPIPDSQPTISLLTIGPGEIFFERFGHNAIVVRDPAGGEAAAYNYGIFDFEQQDFLLNFARGRMRYRIAVDALDDDLAMYRAEGRTITEQRLNLAPEQARALVEFLDWNSRPENAQYRYEYFEANCSTRVRDALDRALGGALHAQSEGRSRGYTYRLDALRLMAPEPLLMLGVDLGLGPYADQRIDFWQESFVPETLRDVVGRASVKSADGSVGPLAIADATLAAGIVEDPPMLPPDLRWPFLGLGLALGALLLWLGGRRRAAIRIPVAMFATVFELFCGVGGAVLLFLWLGTEHHAAWRNENLLLLNPLCLLLVPAWIGVARARWRDRRIARWIAWLVVLGAAFALFSKILPWFVQTNLAWIVLFLPIHIALAIAMTRAR
ncbi:DUF4105 domain-containing protein [Dokdonella soli]|uniref:DUF4105 domain-containing protein n=1 Tax=Dokdonella soli TaxID=529810 RepID=A0ABN1IV92_9GAMM